MGGKMIDNRFEIKKISLNEALIDTAAKWFSSKWGIPYEAYVESMNEAVKNTEKVPEWYVCMDGERIIAGMGVIENDFHNRPDLTPNVCAVYTESEYRCRGIAGSLLSFVCEDMSKKGINTLYLITDHTSLYERFGWEYFCQVMGDGETEPSRMYIHKTR